jgi:hypothetical protein
MLDDRYGNPMSTSSETARDAYVDGLDRFLAARAGVEQALEAAIAADEGFALAHLALARVRQAMGRGEDRKAPLARARELAAGTSERERSHIDAMGDIVAGDVAGGYPKIRVHLMDWPRDGLIAHSCMGVFGLIGFSGLAGREAEQLALTTQLAPAYGDDWWFLCQHAFAQVEAGQTDPATATIEKSLALEPDNPHAAHIRAHVYYESGETDAGYRYIADWQKGYGPSAQLHCHMSWHVALWAMERGDTDAMWAVYDKDLTPPNGHPGKWGPPINVLTDGAALFHRASLNGVQIPPTRWLALSEYASRFFGRPGLAFADVHAALAHAMAGNGEAVDAIIDGAKGPAAPVVKAAAEAFKAIAAGRWAEAVAALTPVMAEHERMGGSRAQRDLLEYALIGALLKQGKTEEAKRLLVMRRPVKARDAAVKGLQH